jgi:uncharacterized membrane protein
MLAVTQLWLLYMGTGGLLILLSLPLIAGWVPPNQLYGFRVTKTLSNPQIWYAANREAGKYLAAAGVCIAVGTTLFYWIKPWELLFYAVACLLITTLSLGYAIVQSFRSLSKMKVED